MSGKKRSPSYPPAPESLPPSPFQSGQSSQTSRSEIPPPRKKKRKRPDASAPKGARLVSLDAYRGFIMTLLAASGFGIARFADIDQDSTIWNSWNYDQFQQWKFHFTHPAWESIRGWMGVSLWDMIQPSFMFMVGVAMPFSYARRSTMGSSSRARLLHAIVRAVVLVLIGVFLSSLNDDHTDWVFPNVLCQIGLGYVFTYLFLSRSPQVQLAGIAMILFGYWGWFMLNPPPENFDYATVKASAEDGEVYEGRYAPWSKNANAAHFFDVAFLNMLRTPDAPPPATDSVGDAPSEAAPVEVASKPGLIRRWFFAAKQPYEFNGGGYTTLNFIPSIATTLLGILCGQLLLSSDANGKKLLTLIVMGAACLGLGILAHHTVCPIVKRIWTPSWVLFSGGYTIWTLAAFFFVFDVLPLRKLAFPLVVVGMNSMAMYLMGQLMRSWVADKVVKIHLGGILQSLFGADALNQNGVGAMVIPTATFAVFWIIAYWMYRNRYFIRV